MSNTHATKLLTIVLLLIVASTARADEALFETSLVFPVTPKNKPNYRIPALVQTPNGDLLAIAERRNDGPGDIGDHDIVFKRSTDRGATWGDVQLLFDGGALANVDTTVGIDRETNTLWVFFMRDKKQFVAASSRDNGHTWDGPHSIHEQVTRPEWDALRSAARDKEPAEDDDPQNEGRMAKWSAGWDQRYGVGPGNAMIQLRSGPRKGRLLVPARHKEDIGKGRLRSFAHTFYSDDHGKSWQLGGTIGMFLSECQLVELDDGRVMVVSRNETSEDAPDNMRHLTSISDDAGLTWSPIARAEELITPRCHGAVERFTLPSDGDKSRLLFSSPASPFRQEEHPYGRYNLTVRLSYDEGRSWSAGRTIWPHPSSYSDVIPLDDGTIGMVYERGPKNSTHYWDEVQFARFNLQWLTFGRDAR
jgi:sialidase-1